MIGYFQGDGAEYAGVDTQCVKYGLKRHLLSPGNQPGKVIHPVLSAEDFGKQYGHMLRHHSQITVAAEAGQTGWAVGGDDRGVRPGMGHGQ